MDDDGELHDLLDRIDAVERRVGALEGSTALAGDPVAPASSPSATGDGDRFWALEGVRSRCPDPGGVVLAGAVTLPDERTAHWQLGAATDDLLRDGLSAGADAFAALGHPARLRILETTLRGTTTVRDLADSGEFGTSGQIYHHLRQLVSARWLTSTGRGRYEVPVDRIVPLFVLGLAVSR